MMNMQSNLQMMPLLQQRQMQQKQQQAQFQTYLSQMQSLGSMLHTLSYGTPLSELNKLHAGVKAQFEANNYELGGRLKNAIGQVKEMRKNIDLDNERYAMKNPDNSESEEDDEFKDALDMLEDEIAHNSQANPQKQNPNMAAQMSRAQDLDNQLKSERNMSSKLNLQASARNYLAPTQTMPQMQPSMMYPPMYQQPYPPHMPQYGYPSMMPQSGMDSTMAGTKKKKREKSESSEEERPKKKKAKAKAVFRNDDSTDSVSALNSPREVKAPQVANMLSGNPMAAMAGMQSNDPMMQNMMMLMMMNNMKQDKKKKKTKRHKSKKRSKEKEPQVYYHPPGAPIPGSLPPGQPAASRRDNDLRKATFSMTESYRSGKPGFSNVRNL